MELEFKLQVFEGPLDLLLHLLDLSIHSVHLINLIFPSWRLQINIWNISDRCKNMI